VAAEAVVVDKAAVAAVAVWVAAVAVDKAAVAVWAAAAAWAPAASVSVRLAERQYRINRVFPAITGNVPSAGRT